MKPRVVGLDLSLTATGVAESDGKTRTIRTGPGDNLADQHDRLSRIVDEARKYVITWPADERVHLVVIEGPSYSSTGAGSWDRAGLWWLVVSSLLCDGTPIAIVPPTVLKRYATGKGNATKADMRMALYQRAGIDCRDDNQVDAHWLRSMGMRWLGHPIEQLPDSQLTAMEKVQWPAIP